MKGRVRPLRVSKSELVEYVTACMYRIVDVRVAYIRKLAILGNREPPGYSQLQPSVLFLSLGAT